MGLIAARESGRSSILVSMAGERRRLTPAKGRYAWDDDIPAAIGSDAPEEATTTTTDQQEARTGGSQSAARGGQAERWRARTLDVASRVAAIEEGIGRAMRPGLPLPRPAVWSHLRRLTGGFAAVRDSLYEATSVAEQSGLSGAGAPYALYVEAVFWWFADLLREVERAAVAGEALDAVAEASSEYAVARVIPAHAVLSDARTDASLAALRGACQALHDDVLWLEWHLKER
jgi:hypothetical protein